MHTQGKEREDRASLSKHWNEGLWKLLLQELATLRKSWFGGYRPERRYMRGGAR